MTDDAPHVMQHVVHASLYRPVLFAGVEFGVLVAEGSIVLAMLVVIGPHVGTVALAIGYAVVVHGVAAWVTARDPLITAVALRHARIRDYYPAHAHPSCPAARVAAAIPPAR